jgi:RHS repeat-associated protein
VDGVKITTLNQYSATIIYQKTWNSPTFSPGVHTVQFVHATTASYYVDIDAIIVTDTARTPTTTPPTPTYTATNTATPTNTPMAVIPDGETWRFYYFAGSQRIAMRTADSTTSSLVYFLGDHLGSTSLTVDPDGSMIAEMRYTAWGETRYTSEVATPTDYQYTGQRSEMNSIGLYYYNARWYDPVLGRFAQADTIVPGGVQGFDRYAYVSNSPIMYVDPSGHSQNCGPDGVLCDDDPNNDDEFVYDPQPLSGDDPAALTFGGKQMKNVFERLNSMCANGTWTHTFCSGGITVKEFMIIILESELSPLLEVNDPLKVAEIVAKLTTAAKNWFSDSCLAHKDCVGATPNAIFNWMGENLESAMDLFPEGFTPTQEYPDVRGIATRVVNAVLSVQVRPKTYVNSSSLVHWGNASYYLANYGTVPDDKYLILGGANPAYIIPYGEEDIMRCGYVGCQAEQGGG